MLKQFKISKSYSFLFISLVITTLFYPERNSIFNESLNFILTIIIILNVLVFLNRLKNIYSSWIRYDTLFILGFLIVHFQIPFLASFGIEPFKPHQVWSDKNVVNFATWFSAMALLLWMLGFYWYLNRNSKKNKYTYLTTKYIVKDRIIRILFVTFFILFFILVGRDFLGGSYSGTLNWGAGSTYIFSFLRYFLFLNIFYFFQKNEGKLGTRLGILNALSKNILIVSLIAIFLLFFLLAGDRGTVLQTGLLIFGSYSIYQKGISLKSFLFFAVLGAMLFFIIHFGRTRDASTRDGNIISAGIENFQKRDGPKNPTEELARSIRILYRALDVVPDEHPHLYGLTLFFNIVDVFPFGGSTYIRVTNIPMMYTSSTSFFTILIRGEDFTAGDGSEIIADLYINIGVWPTLFIFLLFGYLISYFTYRAFYIKMHNSVLIYLILITTSIYVSRATFLTPLKAIIWTLLIDKFLTKKINY